MDFQFTVKLVLFLFGQLCSALTWIIGGFTYCVIRMARFISFFLPDKEHDERIWEPRRRAELQLRLRRFYDYDFFAMWLLTSVNLEIKSYSMQKNTCFRQNYHLKSIAICWQWAASTIELTSAVAASWISLHGLHKLMCSSRIETAQYAWMLYLTQLETANDISLE